MAIWSLTKERYEKLLKQMGDKELDIDTLIKLSKEDLWNKDLDEFVQEWEYQLADEKERAKKVRRLGVRGSSKLKTQVGATKKRKGGDDSDSDFATKKSKKNDPKGGIQSILGAVKPAPKAAPKKTQTKLTELKKPVAKAPSSSFDGIDDSDLQIVAKSKAPAPSKVPKPEPEDSDEEVIKPKAKRAGRGKPVKYSARSDSDSDDDDVDFDVSRMVKGIGETTTTTTVPLARPLFASSAGLSRPGSSAGIIARKSLGRERPILDDDSADETDYTRLAPASNAGKKAPTAKEATVISDDDEDAMDIDAPVPAPVPATKKKGRATGAATKEKAEKPAKTVKAKAPPKAKKEAPLSAAAKAYASKKAKPSAHKVDSDEESDADRLANELLDDDEEDDSIGPAAAARPSRKAATQTKKAWMISDDSEDDFGMDDDSD